MPYQNEYAGNSANQEAMSNDNAAQLLQSLNLKVKETPYERLDKVLVHQYGKNKEIEKVIIIDGSKYETVVDEKYSSKLALFNVNQSSIDIANLLNFLKEDFPTPESFKTISKNHTLQSILPTEGFSNNEYPSEQDFFRYCLFKTLQNNFNPLLQDLKKTHDMPYDETLLGTYTHLFSRLDKTQLKMQPCIPCNKLNHYMKIKDFKDENEQIKWQSICKCPEQKPVFLTDWLSVHSQLGNEVSNEGLTTQVMLILEKLVLINTIRNLVINKKQDLLKKIVFVVDGSLAVYSYASWLSQVIHRELIELKKDNELIIIGIEKTGSFVEHVKKVEKHFLQENAPIAPQALFVFNDDYIQKHISTYDTDSYYGENTHFGKKMYYKNKSGSSFILNIAFENEEDKSFLFNERESKQYIEAIKGIEKITWLFDTFSSNSYDNAFSLLSFAHQGAALSTSEMGKRLLDKFLKNIVQ